MLHTNGSTFGMLSNNAEFIDLLLGDNSDGSKSVGSTALSPIFLLGVLTVDCFRAIGAMFSTWSISLSIYFLFSSSTSTGQLQLGSITAILINSEILN